MKQGHLFVNQKHKKILEILQSHVGYSNQISSGEIGPMIGIQEDATHLKVRTLIREIIHLLHIPIGGGESGYYIIETGEEMSKYIKQLESRMRQIEKRKNMVLEAFLQRDTEEHDKLKRGGIRRFI